MSETDVLNKLRELSSMIIVIAHAVGLKWGMCPSCDGHGSDSAFQGDCMRCHGSGETLYNPEVDQ